MHARPGPVGLAGGHRYLSLDSTRLTERKLRESQERLHAFLLASTTSMYWSEMRELDGQGFLPDTAVAENRLAAIGWTHSRAVPMLDEQGELVDGSARPRPSQSATHGSRVARRRRAIPFVI